MNSPDDATMPRFLAADTPAEPARINRARESERRERMPSNATSFPSSSRMMSSRFWWVWVKTDRIVGSTSSACLASGMMTQTHQNLELIILELEGNDVAFDGI